jgi:hypothetical protein
MAHDPRAAVLDMVQAIERVQRLAAGLSETTFLQNEQAQWAVFSQIVILGEAHRDRQELSGLRPGREGLPRWLHRVLHAGQPTVSRPHAGPRRWQSAHAVPSAGPSRSAGGR